jgi:hypothetical protein
MSSVTHGAEFAIINGTYYFSEGANAFTCHVSPPYPSNVPTNWLSPHNYWNGRVYAYYKVLDIPTNEPFALQMGIFQYYPNAAEWDGQNYRETCSTTIPRLQGMGDEEWVDYGTPANWWQHPTGAVDFTRVYDYESVGPVFYSRTQGAYGILYPPDAAAWAVRYNYFPCSLRVIVVFVSSGSTFSGWENYMNGGGGGGGCTPTQQPTPSYSVDFTNETTNKAVPSTDEYSYNANMSGAVSGNGQKLHLTPGQDVYFRTKASGECYTESEVFHLDVPNNRPATPNMTIDYGNLKTNEVLPSTLAYSLSSDHSNPVNGQGTRLDLTSGQDLWIWVKATSSAFSSLDQHLDVPARPVTPTVGIDYDNERTTSLPSTQEWSIHSDLSEATSGSGAGVALSPGTNLYIRTKTTASSFPSLIQTLVVPNRAGGPAYSVDFIHETTAQVVPTTVQYSTHADLSSALDGPSDSIGLTPGTDMYFRTKATPSAFKSNIAHMNVPERPRVVYTGPVTVNTPTVTMSATLPEGYTGFELSDLAVTNGTAQNLRENHTFDVVAAEEGTVRVNIAPNTLGDESFASGVVEFTYTIATNGLDDTEKNQWMIYPNPTHHDMMHLKTGGKPVSEIEILSAQGTLIRAIAILEKDEIPLDLKGLQKVLYLVRITSGQSTFIQKIVLE